MHVYATDMPRTLHEHEHTTFLHAGNMQVIEYLVTECIQDNSLEAFTLWTSALLELLFITPFNID